MLHPSLGSIRFATVFLAATLAFLPAAFAQTCTPLVPCADPRGCPDLTIDPGIMAARNSTIVQMHTFAPTDCAVVEGMAVAGTRRLLLFSTQGNNLGPGAVVLGNPADHPDWFEFATCHGHYHIKDYADYRLWTPAGYTQWKALRAANPGVCAAQVLDANPSLLSQLVKGNKLGLCFFDVVMMGQLRSATEICPRTLDPQTYFDCNFAGLGVCWADIYEAGLFGSVDGQWIDITDLPDGEYVLENESNATHLITEADYDNNSTALRVRIKGKNLHILGPA
jgi:Lysyl oxidase